MYTPDVKRTRDGRSGRFRIGETFRITQTECVRKREKRTIDDDDGINCSKSTTTLTRHKKQLGQNVFEVHRALPLIYLLCAFLAFMCICKRSDT